MSTEADYFATMPADKIGNEIQRRTNQYYANGTQAAQVTWLQVQAWMSFYGFGTDWFHGTSNITYGGDQGEMNYVRMGQARSIANAAVAQVTSLSMGWQPQADKYSSDSLIATKKAKDVLEHIQQNCGMRNAYDEVAEGALVMGEKFIMPYWDPFAGKPALAVRGQSVPGGDFRFRTVSSWDVIRNPGKQSYEDLDYVFVRLRDNRWNLAKLYPHMAQEIMDAPRSMSMDSSAFGFGMLNNSSSLWDEDDIQVIRLLVNPSASLPDGRDTLVLRGGGVLEDGPLKYGMWPLIRVSKARMQGTPFPYTEYFDMMGSAQVYDNLHSAFTTNLLTHGTSLFTYERGTNPDIMALGGGLAGLPYDPGGKPPEVVNYAKVPEGGFAYLATLKTEMEQDLGQNAVTRGQSPGDRAPASLAALLDATSARQASPFLKSYVRALEYGGKLVLRMFQHHVKRPYRVTLGVGAPAASLRWKDVKPEDIAGIDQVYVISGDDSFATRLQKAEMLSTVVDPQHRKEIMEVAETGRIEPVVLATEEQYTLILAENEAIQRGEAPTAHPSDDNYFHVAQHATAVCSTAARKDPKVMKADAEHFRMHYSQAFGVPLEAVGQVVAPVLGPDGLPLRGPDGKPLQGPGADPNYMQNCQILRGQPVTPPGATMPGGAMPAPSATPPPGPGASTQTAPPKAPPAVSASGAPNAAPKPAQLPPNASTKAPWDPVSAGGTATPHA